MMPCRSLLVPVLIGSTALCACTRSLPVASTAGYIQDTASSGMTSWNGQRTERVVMQRLDYSCGAAALATLMSYYFTEPLSESDVLDDVERLFDADEREVISRDGLSFAELERIARERGYASASVALRPSALERLDGPVIVYLRGPRFNHFAVFRDVVDGWVRLADPSRGNVTIPIQRFLEVWKGETLVLGLDDFGTPADHPLRGAIDPIEMPAFVDVRAPRLSPWIRVPR